MTLLNAVELDRFRAGVQQAAARNDVRHAVENVYRALQDRIELRRPICAASGRCCRFDEFGHRLFVTTMELGAFVAQVKLQGIEQQRREACPFQSGKLCTVHQVRPFGCRIFFCDETSTDWQREQYEFFHAELKRLHYWLKIPYFYLEWRSALSAIALDPGPVSNPSNSL